MRKKLGCTLIGLGVALILSALFLLIYNQWENANAGSSAEMMLNDVQTAMAEQKFAVVDAEQTANPNQIEQTEAVEIASAEIAMINGYNYLGILEIPSLDLKLPVLSDCDDSLLKIAPCRDYGYLSTSDLVIAAHNYRSHFGRLSQLQSGDEVHFTDMNGITHDYEVTKSMMLSAGDVDLIVNSGCELVLYTCDYTNQNRIAVYCREDG